MPRKPVNVSLQGSADLRAEQDPFEGLAPDEVKELPSMIEQDALKPGTWNWKYGYPELVFVIVIAVAAFFAGVWTS